MYGYDSASFRGGWEQSVAAQLPILSVPGLSVLEVLYIGTKEQLHILLVLGLYGVFLVAYGSNAARLGGCSLLHQRLTIGVKTHHN